MLASCTAGAVCINPKIIVIDINLNVILNIRNHVAGRKRRLPLARRIKRGNPHQTVYPLLRTQEAISILTGHLKGHALDPGHVSFQIVQDFQRKAFLLRPPAVHPVEHPGPVAGLGSAGSRVQRHDGVALIVLSRQKRLNPQFLELRLEPLQLLLDLRDGSFIRLLLAHLNEKPQILMIRKHALNLLDRVLKAFQLLHGMLGFLRTVPEARFFDISFQLFDSFLL